MAPQRLKVNINAGKGIGGIFPFAVACFDGNIAHELFKSKATTTQPDGVAVWDESFTVDLAHEMKTFEAENRPPPKYLTLFLFDTGSQGIPSLGSAGILLSNVHEKGRSAGDFPVVNGSGSLSLVAVLEKSEKEGFFHSDEGFLHSDAAKVTGAVAGATAAVGLGALAFNHYKQKKKKRAEEEDEQQTDQYAEENRADEQLLQQQQQQQADANFESSSDDEYAVQAGQAGDTYAQQAHAPVGNYNAPATYNNAPRAYHAPGAAYASGHVHNAEGEDDEDDDDED